MGIVEAAHRALGVIARVNERLGRYRVNFIPANALLLFGLGTFSVLSWNTVGKVLASRTAPEPQTVDALISTTRFAQGYVAVRGKLMAGSRLSFGAAGSPRSLGDYAWVPLADAA